MSVNLMPSATPSQGSASDRTCVHRAISTASLFCTDREGASSGGAPPSAAAPACIAGAPAAAGLSAGGRGVARQRWRGRSSGTAGGGGRGAAQAGEGRRPCLTQLGFAPLITCGCSRPAGGAHPRQKGSAAAYARSRDVAGALAILCRHCARCWAAPSAVERFADSVQVCTVGLGARGAFPLVASALAVLVCAMGRLRGHSPARCFRCWAHCGGSTSAGTGRVLPPLNAPRQCCTRLGAGQGPATSPLHDAAEAPGQGQEAAEAGGRQTHQRAEAEDKEGCAGGAGAGGWQRPAAPAAAAAGSVKRCCRLPGADVAFIW